MRSWPAASAPARHTTRPPPAPTPWRRSAPPQQRNGAAPQGPPQPRPTRHRPPPSPPRPRPCPRPCPHPRPHPPAHPHALSRRLGRTRSLRRSSPPPPRARWRAARPRRRATRPRRRTRPAAPPRRRRKGRCHRRASRRASPRARCRRPLVASSRLLAERARRLRRRWTFSVACERMGGDAARRAPASEVWRVPWLGADWTLWERGRREVRRGEGRYRTKLTERRARVCYNSHVTMYRTSHVSHLTHQTSPTPRDGVNSGPDRTPKKAGWRAECGAGHTV